MILNEDQIKSTPIEDVVGHYVQIKRKGNLLKGLCPFHNEKTPSFTVTPSLGIFKCFGCDEGGDGVTFVMKHLSLTYPEALKEIAKIGGIQVEEQQRELTEAQKSELSEKNTQRMLMQFATDHYASRANSRIGSNQRIGSESIFGRSISKETAAKFKLGLSTDYTSLADTLKSAKVDLELAQRLMLVAQGKNGYYDSYNHRIIIPILDYTGKPIALAGRKTEKSPKDSPKYVNSRQSAIYTKGDHLFGASLAKQAARAKKFTYLTEGYFDVITLHDQGIQNVVAKSGTALTKNQIALLLKLSKTVVIITDNDTAGMKAMSADIVSINQAGGRVSIVILPEGEDPDSYIRKVGADKFKKYIDDKTQDGIIYHVMNVANTGKMKDPYHRDRVLDLAAFMLAQKSDSILDYYTSELTSPSRLGAVKKQLLKKIATRREDIAEEQEVVVDEQQAENITKYSIYRKGNKYWASDSPKSFGFSITNFVINPIMLIIGKEKSIRLFELANNLGHKIVVPIAAEDFLDMKQFWKKITGWGEFTFNEYAQPLHFIRIHRMVIHKMTTCEPILGLGQHQDGFYAFGNGVIIGGQFVQADKYGVITINKKSYYLPNAGRELLESQFSMDFHKGYEYKQSAISAADWMHQFMKVHKTTGTLGILWVLGAIFRDIWFDQFQAYPLLNLFGPPGLGKNFFGRSIIALWGNPSLRKPMLANQNTDAGIYGVLAQLTNGVPWIDEYSADLDRRKLDAIKGAYDSTGRTKRNGADDRATTQTPINSALMFSGQFLPITPDPAIYERCIPLEFATKSFTEADLEAAAKLKGWENEGLLTSVLSEIIKHRETIADTFYESYLAVQADVKAAIKSKSVIKERFVMNFTIILTMRRVLADKIKFPFSYQEALDTVIENLIRQNSIVADENDTAVFWKIVQNLISNYHLREGQEWMLQGIDKITILDELSKKSKPVGFDEPKQVLFLRITKAGEMYRKEFKMQYSKSGMGDKEIQFYLSQDDAFIGVVKSKTFKTGTYKCLAFDFGKMALEISGESGESENHP